MGSPRADEAQRAERVRALAAVYRLVLLDRKKDPRVGADRTVGTDREAVRKSTSADYRLR